MFQKVCVPINWSISEAGDFSACGGVLTVALWLKDVLAQVLLEAK